MADDTGRIIGVRGANLWVEEAGTGSTVVLVHSGITDARMWDDQWAALAAGHHVIRYDLRGYGRSSIPPQPFTHHDDLLGLFNALGVESAALVAASMGGEVALAFTLEHPERVRRLVLVNTLAGTDSRSEELRAGWREMERAFDAGGLDAAVEIELRMWVDGPRRSPADVDPGLRERVRMMDHALLAREAEQELASEGQPNRPTLDHLHEIDVPTLVISGALDMPDALVSAQRLQSAIPGAIAYEFANAAHLPNLECAAEFTTTVGGFLAEP